MGSRWASGLTEDLVSLLPSQPCIDFCRESQGSCGKIDIDPQLLWYTSKVFRAVDEVGKSEGYPCGGGAERGHTGYPTTHDKF